MQSRATRFWLRFETGARQGEQVPLPPGVVTLGRRSDNTIVVVDGSVSGHHAQIQIEESGAVLKDLGSTNGTKVRGQKITTAELAPGDSFLLGALRFTLLAASPEGTGEPGGVEIEGLDSAPPPERTATDVVESVDAETVARARSRSRTAPLLFVLLLAAAGVAAWRFWPREEGHAPAAVQHTIPGNLLSDGAFETGDAAGFESVDSAPQGFLCDGAFARSGRFGLGVTLNAGEWALARSQPFALSPGRRAVLQAAVSGDVGTFARFGIELSSSDARKDARILWGEAIAGDGAFAEADLPFTTWTGYDQGRVCLAALGQGAGSVAFDDVGVVPGDAPLEPAATFDEFEADRIGSAVVIVRSGSPLLGPIEFGRWAETGLDGFPRATLDVEAAPNGFVLRASATPADAWCSLQGPRGAGSAQGGASTRIATLGPDGYQAHANEFERARTSAVLLGDGLDLVKIVFARPVTVRGATKDGVSWLAAEVGEEGVIEVQLSFREERAEASLLESRARAAENAGRFGEALRTWSELLDRVPFEARLVEAATSERARRLQAGLEELAILRAAFERGRFFELADLYREVRAQAQVLCASYAGTEVEREGRGLVADIDGALSSFGSEDDAVRVRRVFAVLSTLDEARSPALHARVRAGLEPPSGARQD